jgi:hypothetical protein
MKWTLQASTCLVAVLLAACNGNRDRNAGTPGSGAESGSMSDSSTMSTDTGGMRSTSGMSADTARNDTSASGMTRSDTSGDSSRIHSDSAAKNQSQSGVTDSKTGKSTLGQGAEKTRPDQGEPVTSKGDTVSRGADSAR